MDMYAKFGCSEKASAIFEKNEACNVVSMDPMIANLAQNGAESEAFRLFIEMQKNGECSNAFTIVNLLAACSRVASLNMGKHIHTWSIHRSLMSDLFVSNALIDTYAKCGKLSLALNIFDRSEKDDVSCNTLIVGHSQWGLPKLSMMPFTGCLSACANLSASKQGKEIHGVFRRLLSTLHFLDNSLLDLYSKGGMLDTASKIFNRIAQKDVASWNTMVLGYGMHGQLDVAFELFDLMKDDGVDCDHVSCIEVLSACSHGGLVERGKKYFQMLAQNIKPQQMHYACMVIFLGVLVHCLNLLK
ncbi:pentatricopeptide repeat-containing protein [Panicum miliaceum]|uniref:Pentatricopeptide repeat-containing protein n=1 Tax=Panicum miliaceum TaxID=4540 RepID=A0A3L6THK4_PANMI|nr:pentatricopeptide repeat-containing protein [Panicum miliaceum]